LHIEGFMPDGAAEALMATMLGAVVRPAGARSRQP
jgi:hypothetical protein